MDAKVKVKKPSFFKMRAQMLEKGRTNTALARTDNMWATLKVYASGGENGLHCHPREDHTFLVLQGKARYYDADGGHMDVGKHEGIMLPAGAYYWFEAISKEPLVLVRIGCRVGPEDANGRLNIRGEPMPGDSKENKRVPVVYREGEFFE
jgi:mannose-6-phosphate isomerase-like protein (cupin superfamily)